ncbi:MAG TPA: DoxX family protein [Pirellulales bacterium]|jgi:hypothetical protein
MSADAQKSAASKRLFWIGWGVTILPLLVLIASGGAKLSQSESVIKSFDHLGWPPGLLLPLATIELTCIALYLNPRTAPLGAILLTGYLGGATATHVRLGEWDAVAPVVVGVLLWLGLFLRDSRIRTLIPIRMNL